MPLKGFPQQKLTSSGAIPVFGNFNVQEKGFPMHLYQICAIAASIPADTILASQYYVLHCCRNPLSAAKVLTLPQSCTQAATCSASVGALTIRTGLFDYIHSYQAISRVLYGLACQGKTSNLE